MKSKALVFILSTLAFALLAPDARGGAIRATGKAIGEGSVAVAGGVANAATATGGAVKSGAVATKDGATAAGKGAAATPALIGHGTKVAAKKAWKIIW